MWQAQSRAAKIKTSYLHDRAADLLRLRLSLLCPDCRPPPGSDMPARWRARHVAADAAAPRARGTPRAPGARGAVGVRGGWRRAAQACPQRAGGQAAAHPGTW